MSGDVHHDRGLAGDVDNVSRAGWLAGILHERLSFYLQVFKSLRYDRL
jgi:hypothetical protein